MQAAIKKIELTEVQIEIIKNEINDAFELGKKVLQEVTEEMNQGQMVSVLFATNEMRKILEKLAA